MSIEQIEKQLIQERDTYLQLPVAVVRLVYIVNDLETLCQFQSLISKLSSIPGLHYFGIDAEWRAVMRRSNGDYLGPALLQV